MPDGKRGSKDRFSLGLSQEVRRRRQGGPQLFLDRNPEIGEYVRRRRQGGPPAYRGKR